MPFILLFHTKTKIVNLRYYRNEEKEDEGHLKLFKFCWEHDYENV
jgi:hypothetical protein